MRRRRPCFASPAGGSARCRATDATTADAVGGGVRRLLARRPDAVVGPLLPSTADNTLKYGSPTKLKRVCNSRAEHAPAEIAERLSQRLPDEQRILCTTTEAGPDDVQQDVQRAFASLAPPVRGAMERRRACRLNRVARAGGSRRCATMLFGGADQTSQRRGGRLKELAPHVQRRDQRLHLPSPHYDEDAALAAALQASVTLHVRSSSDEDGEDPPTPPYWRMRVVRVQAQDG